MTRFQPRPWWALPALVAALTASACRAPSGRAPSTIQARVEVHATSDDGQPLAHVELTRGNRVLGETAATGLLGVTLPGTEGQAVSLGVGCPDGFLDQTEPRVVRLARTRSVGASETAPVKVDVVCERRQRSVVLVVRATGGAGLTITVNGERAAVTDGDGIAHVLLRVARAVRSLEVAFDTGSRKDLAGQGNRRVLELGPSDTVLVVDQRFTPKAPPPVARAAKKVAPPEPTHRAPTRID